MYFFLIWLTEFLPLRSTEKDDLEEIKSELGNISEQLQTLLAKPREELRPLRDKGKSLKVTNAFIGYLTNRPQFCMAYTLTDHRIDVIKCSKLKWNHKPQGEWFHCKVLNILWRYFYVL